MAEVKNGDISMCNWKHMRFDYVISGFGVMEREVELLHRCFEKKKVFKHYQTFNMKKKKKAGGRKSLGGAMLSRDAFPPFGQK